MRYFVARHFYNKKTRRAPLSKGNAMNSLAAILSIFAAAAAVTLAITAFVNA